MSTGHVLLAGGAGFVGYWTAREFLDAGWRVTVLDPAAAEPGRVPEGCGRVARPVDAEPLREILRAGPPGVIVGLGAFGTGGRGLLAAADEDPGAAVAVNVGCLATLLEAAARAGTRRAIWSSSTVVYGRTAVRDLVPAKESRPADPDSLYGLSKQLAEVTADWFRKFRSVEATGVRLPLVLGPRLHYRGAAAVFVDAVVAGSAPDRIGDDVSSDILYVKDVARLLVQLAEFPDSLRPIYNAPSFPLRFSEFLAELARQRPGSTVPLAPPTDSGTPMMWRTLSDARLRDEVGFVPHFGVDAMISDWLSEVVTEAPRA